MSYEDDLRRIVYARKKAVSNQIAYISNTQGRPNQKPQPFNLVAACQSVAAKHQKTANDVFHDLARLDR